MLSRVISSPRNATHSAPPPVRRAGWLRRLEAPTWALWALIHAGFAAVTLAYHDLPGWLVAALGGWFACWHGQLQHEHLHGHPTRSALLNGLLVAPSFGLWLPYVRYRDLHIAHHRAAVLTDPAHDNESYYVSRATWERLPRPARALLWANQTLAGRMLLGPALVVLPWLWSELRRLARSEADVWRAWLLHAVALLPLMWWLTAVCRIPLGDYLLLFVWPGLALTLIRSFYEHRLPAAKGRDSVIVERPGLLGLLFLNNNLHALHHDEPGLPWYALPSEFIARRAAYVGGPHDFRFDGYAAWFRRYFLRPKDAPVYPGP